MVTNKAAPHKYSTLSHIERQSWWLVVVMVVVVVVMVVVVVGVLVLFLHPLLPTPTYFYLLQPPLLPTPTSTPANSYLLQLPLAPTPTDSDPDSKLLQLPLQTILNYPNLRSYIIILDPTSTPSLVRSNVALAQ